MVHNDSVNIWIILTMMQPSLVAGRTLQSSGGGNGSLPCYITIYAAVKLASFLCHRPGNIYNLYAK